MGSVFGSLPHLKFSGEFGKDEHANTVATYGGDNVVRSSFLTNVFNGNYLGLFLDKIKVFYPKPPTPTPDFLRELDMVVTGMKGSMDTNRHGLLVIVVLLLAMALFAGYKTISVLLHRRRKLKRRLHSSLPGPTGVQIGPDGGPDGTLKVTPVRVKVESNAKAGDDDE